MTPDERLIIAGGGPAGLSTAQAYREAGGRGRVTILASESYPPYRRPPLTKEYLRGEIPREELPMLEHRWYEENNVELRTSTTVTAFDPGRMTVETENGEIPYDACVLATGSEPLRLPVSGAEDPEIQVMRTIEDSVRLQERAEKGSRAVVVGSGFIGCEAAASLAMRGVGVTMISLDNSPQELRLGGKVGSRILSWLEGYGVRTRFGVGIEGIERGDAAFTVGFGGGSVDAETVVFGVGVKPRVELAESAGLETNEGGIVTDSSMRTSAPNVFAVGDISYAYNEAAHRHLHVEHWGEALNHGVAAGKTIAGVETSWRTAPGFWSTIGENTIKYVAWGDGWDEAEFTDHGEKAFSVRYGRKGTCVGVLTHNCDEEYERGRELVESKSPMF